MTAHEILSRWEAFYVIVGSSAGALTGLQFVLIALVADRPGTGGHREISAFGTPTVVHFVAVLLVGSIISAPWEDLSHVAIVIGLFGVTGVAYTAIVTRRTQQTERYTPVMEDWIFHVILPFVAYFLLLGASVTLTRFDTPALFAVGTASLLLLTVGVHNAWDTVTYIALDMRASDPAQPKTDATTTAKP